ncbi:unnamed protein product [Prunus brigantina]
MAKSHQSVPTTEVDWGEMSNVMEAACDTGHMHGYTLPKPRAIADAHGSLEIKYFGFSQQQSQPCSKS